MTLLRLLLVTATAAIIRVRPAPIPITRIGISRSHCPEGEAVVAAVVVEVAFVCVLVAPARVVLLVVVAETVVVFGTYMIVAVLLCDRAGNVNVARIVKIKSRSELVLERTILSRIDN